MRIIRAGLRPLVGGLVVAHGLTHSVSPLRGGLDPAMLPHDFMPMIFYSVAVIGFCMAGLGIVGWRPFAGAARPLLVVASAYSLIGMVRMQTVEPLGVALDLVLLLTGLTGAYRRLPAPPDRSAGYGHALRVAGGVALVAAAVIIVLRLPFRM